MIAAIVLFAIASGGAVPVPEGNFPGPGHDYKGGPLDGVMSQLRDGRRQLPNDTDLKAINSLVDFGFGKGRVNVDKYSEYSAKHIITPYSSLEIRSQKITAGFLTQYKWCQRTKPMLIGQQADSQSVVRMFWSCGEKPGRYLMKDTIILKAGKVVSWNSDSFSLIPLAPPEIR